MSNGEGVTYTVKELISMLEEKLVEQIGGIVSRLDKIDSKLDDKVSLARFRELEDRFEKFKEKIEGSVGKLENTASGGVALGKVGLILITTVGVAVFLACVTLIAAAISGGHL